MGDRAVTGSHADAPRKAPWGVGGSWVQRAGAHQRHRVGGSWVQGVWSPSETWGRGQLGAGELGPVRDTGWGAAGCRRWSPSESDSPLGRGSSLWLVALQITLFFRQ